ncbi:SAM-dependent methyltransferase [Rhodovibrio salinarum]|uniref:SAM-dependent methyltransferase n=2 Tax=Rhodovibrio salinarum TaxID=1087 RepID=A0A934QG49_9PROT|nr:class I SAM-dependent methyltransferase [Rhodovibrio salinarum]MBK1695880.1 SAM-dependent methyltransferase [Rhodovibrio salinarum]
MGDSVDSLGDGPVAQHWNPERYQREAGFVAELGRPLLTLLAAQTGARVLDLGCGDGRLTLEVAAGGAQVTGVDLSPDLVATARGRGLDVQVADAAALPYPDASFDAVLSNAALHWMTAPEPVLGEVARVLKPGGRFVGEMGGAGNVAAIVGAITNALAQRGIEVTRAYPWYFPTLAQYRAQLEAAGFTVDTIERFARPTDLPADITGWLATFAESFLSLVPASQRDQLVGDIRDALEPSLKQADGRWAADYVRLRFSAHKAAT